MRRTLCLPLKVLKGSHQLINEIIGKISFFFKPDLNGLVSQPWLRGVWDEKMLVICMTSGRPMMIERKEIIILQPFMLGRFLPIGT